MVIRVHADTNQWMSMKEQIYITSTNAFELSLYNLIIERGYHDENYIQRVEVKLPDVVSKEERHAIYKRSSKNKFKAVREDDSCMRIFMSKKYINELLLQHEVLAIRDDMMNTKIDDCIDTSVENIQNITSTFKDI